MIPQTVLLLLLLTVNDLGSHFSYSSIVLHGMFEAFVRWRDSRYQRIGPAWLTDRQTDRETDHHYHPPIDHETDRQTDVTIHMRISSTNPRAAAALQGEISFNLSRPKNLFPA